MPPPLRPPFFKVNPGRPEASQNLAQVFRYGKYGSLDNGNDDKLRDGRLLTVLR